MSIETATPPDTLAWRRPPPEETVRRVLERRPLLGLTRLADITHLDRIGVPVVLAVRPQARYLSVDAGKGMTLALARASAAMETVERHAGEAARPPSWRATYPQCAAEHRVIDRVGLPLSRHSLFSDALVIDWTLAWDMVSDEDVAVPLEIVALDRFRRNARETLPFQTGSNGLSAGNTLAEAIFGGLCELIERDALACMRRAWEHFDRPPPRLRLEAASPGIGPATHALLDRFAAAGIEIAAFDCRSDIDVPVYMVYAIDRLTPHFGLFRGYGCHIDPETALQRALTEAAQGRLVTIAGSRDDLFGFNRILGRPNYDAAADIVAALPVTAALAARDLEAPPDPDHGIFYLVERLRRAGLVQVIVADLTVPEIGIPAVRVIVPGLEGYVFESYSPGLRARRIDTAEENN
jgi:ribosomal protein S12 methylthiotransferase accessory factor